MTCKDLIVNGIARIVGKIYSTGGFVGNLTGNCSGSSSSCTGTAENAKKVNNLTVQTAVPANAVFTDTKAASSLTCTSGTYGGSSATTSVQGALNNLTSGLNGKVSKPTVSNIVFYGGQSGTLRLYPTGFTGYDCPYSANCITEEISGYIHRKYVINITIPTGKTYPASKAAYINIYDFPDYALGGPNTIVSITASRKMVDDDSDAGGFEYGVKAYSFNHNSSGTTYPTNYNVLNLYIYNRNSSTVWPAGSGFIITIDSYVKNA